MSDPSPASSGPPEPLPPETARVPGEDMLPPVQPPGAGFIMQLFFIPLIIVAILVSVWLMFSWLAHMGSRPDQIVDDFQRLNDATWQQALTLANMLRDPSSDVLRRDARLAQRLAAILQQQTDSGHLSESHLRFRMYLCRALGEFDVADGLPALVHAAHQANSLEQWQVRRAALEAIGLLIDHVGASQVEQNSNLLPLLQQIAAERGDQPPEQQPRAKLRGTAAFVLGLLERDESLATLVALLDDPDPLVAR